MTTVKEIEKAVSSLPIAKLSVFRSWFEKFDAVRWDKQIEGDIKKDKLNALAAKARESYKKGKTKAL